VFSVLAVLALGILYRVLPRQRRPLLVGSVLATPQALASLFLVPGYWKPEYLLAVSRRIGLEDILFNFYMGGVAWLLSTWFVGRRLTVRFRMPDVLRRYLYTVLFGLAVGCPLYLAGARPIDVGLIVFFLWTGVLLLVRPRLWPLVPTGAVSAFVFAATFYRVNVLAWPRISGYFNWTELWGPSLGRIPLEEYAYFILFCPAWALTTAFLLDAQVAPSRRTLRASARSAPGAPRASRSEDEVRP
jgi:hypothetical protein